MFSKISNIALIASTALAIQSCNIVKDDQSNMLDDTNMVESCGDDHEKVGQSFTFAEYAHDVSGQAEIIDNCTIRLTNFNFDGGGPAVYFYTGNAGVFSNGSGMRVSEKLTDAYENETVDITVSNLDDFDSLSVWCAQFGIDFGSGTFE